jgi:hypothetical protein
MQSLWQELLGRAAMKPDTWGTDEAPFVPSMEAFKSRMLRPLSDELGTGPPRITSIPQELRPLLWQFTLGLLPCGQSSGELVTVLAANRRRYTDLCTRYLVDPSKQNRPQQQPDWNLMNPLSQDEQASPRCIE